MFSAHTQMAAGDRSRRDCSPGSENPACRVARGLCLPAHPPKGQHSWGPKFLTRPLFIHLPCAQHRPAAQSTVLSALISVLPGNYLAPTERPLTEITSCSSLLGQDWALAGPYSKVPPCTPKAMPEGHPLDSHGSYTALALALTTLCLNCPGVCLSLA